MEVNVVRGIWCKTGFDRSIGIDTGGLELNVVFDPALVLQVVEFNLYLVDKGEEGVDKLEEIECELTDFDEKDATGFINPGDFKELDGLKDLETVCCKLDRLCFSTGCLFSEKLVLSAPSFFSCEKRVILSNTEGD